MRTRGNCLFCTIPPLSSPGAARFMIQLSLPNVALKAIWIPLEIFLGVSSPETPHSRCLVCAVSPLSRTKHMLGTHCEVGFVQQLQGTKENKMSSLLPSEKCKRAHTRQRVRTLFSIHITQLTPEGQQSTRYNLTERTVMKHSCVIISPPLTLLPHSISFLNPTGSH